MCCLHLLIVISGILNSDQSHAAASQFWEIIYPEATI